MAFKHFVIASTLLLTSWAAQAEMAFVADPGPPRFCMQSFNAYGPAYALHMKERTDWMMADLEGRPRCDVIHFQEVWNDKQINIVEDALRGMYHISDPNRKEKIGVMSLFMGDIISTETHDFKVNSDGNILDRGRELFNVKKAFHIVKASVGVDEDLYFMNTHLHPTSQAVRLTQILELLDWRVAHQDLKMLLSGDFNGDEHSLERSVMMYTMGLHDSLLETLGGTYPKGLCTYCKDNPLSWLWSDHILDYIFFSNVGGSATHLHPLDGSINMRGTPRHPLSDHYGLRINFAMEPSSNAVDSNSLEQRRTEALKLFDQIIQILSSQKKQADFAPALQKARDYQAQLATRQGEFNSYFEKFN